MHSRILASLALASLVSASGCAHHDDPPASVAAAAAAAVTSLPQTGFAGATAATFATAKLPVYPKADYFDSGPDTMTPHVSKLRAEFTSSDPASSVDAWYKAHLDASFKRKTGVGMMNSTVYVSGVEGKVPEREVSLVKVTNFPDRGTVTDIILETTVK